MRVVVNRLAATGLKTGVGHYTAQLLRCLHELAEPGEIEEFPRGWVRRLREACAHLRPRLEGGRSGGAPGFWGGSLAALRKSAVSGLRHASRVALAGYFRIVCARGQYDLYHEPNFVPLPSGRPTVTTICDLSVLLHPEWHPRDRVHYFEKHFQRGVANSVHFLAISDWGRQEIMRTLNVPPDRITRTYMGIRPGLGPLPAAEVAATLQHLGLPPRYLLCLGTIEPRKNVLLLLRAYCALPEALRRAWPLLLVGAWGWNTAEVADYFHNEARHRGVLHFGYLADRYVPAIYNGARALVYPSLYEGFGLPPLEMMACGGAVLASTAGALVETVGSRAHLTAPDDLDGWRSALKRVLTDDDWWRSLRHGVAEVARPFTWERCAAETLCVYRSLCGVPVPSIALSEQRRKAG
jgi:glycosyltransferase involved in cell wall biosynthesis